MPQGPSPYFFGCNRNIRYLESHAQYKGKIGKIKKIGLIILREIQAAGMRLRMRCMIAVIQMGVPYGKNRMHQHP